MEKQKEIQEVVEREKKLYRETRATEVETYSTNHNCHYEYNLLTAESSSGLSAEGYGAGRSCLRGGPP
jgi:hypothetical protein